MKTDKNLDQKRRNSTHSEEELTNSRGSMIVCLVNCLSKKTGQVILYVQMGGCVLPQ